MMNAVDEEHVVESKIDATGGTSNQAEHAKEKVNTAMQREQAPSEAARREKRELQRRSLHEHKTRRSVLNNRFLSRKESRATSNREKGESESPKPKSTSPSKVKTSFHKKKTAAQPEISDDSARDDDDWDMKPASPVAEESALVVTRRRSSAGSTAAGNDKANGRNDRDGVIREVIVTPSVHVIPSFALKRSKWTRELDEDAACGLYVDDERRELSQIASSTLVRLEERQQRELSGAPNQENATANTVRLNDLLHVPHTQDNRLETSEKRVSLARQQIDSSPALKHRRKAMWKIATLEITIDRLVLDDHISFSLADRIETQLRSLFVSYTHLIHAQPWNPLMQRIDTFVEAYLRRQSEKGFETSHTWLAQAQLDAQTVLQSLRTLQQLHYQLLAKWHELQDCYRQPALPNRPTKLRLCHHKRAEVLILSSLRAFLEIDSPDQGMNEVRSKLEKRLDEIDTKDQFLDTILTVDTVVDAPSSRSTPRLTRNGHISGWSNGLMGTRQPRFYVVLFINDKEVGRTRVASWSSSPKNKHATVHVGLISIKETLRTQLQFFPNSVALKVFERGFVTDTLLSTTSIPLLVPGHDLVKTVSLNEPRDRIAAASLAPSIEWYQFSSVHAMPRSRWHATFLNSSHFATFQRHLHGRVRVHVAWTTPLTGDVVSQPLAHNNQREDEDEIQPVQVVLPNRRQPVAGRDNAKLVGPRLDRRHLYGTQDDDEYFGRRNQSCHTGFSYERDFLVHIADPNTDPQLAVDRNDPLNAAVVRLQDHVRTQSTLLKERDVFRASSLVYVATLLQTTSCFNSGQSALTRRNFLLQLRDREHVAKHGTSMIVADAVDSTTGKTWDHDAFDEPLPLSEHAIATNSKFLTLLRPEVPAFDYRQQLDSALAVDGSSRFSIERERKLQSLKLQDFVSLVRATQVARAHNKALASSGKQRDRTKTLAAIIQEKPLPLLPGAVDFSVLGNLFSRRRRLRPHVETRLEPATMADWPRQCTLYVQIKSAMNVPVRITPTRGLTTQLQPAAGEKREVHTKKRATVTDGDGDDDDHQLSQENQARESAGALGTVENSHVFVEISFQGRRRRTTSTHVRATGAVWMETVALPFNAPRDDWTPDSIQKSSDVIRLNLFDQRVRTSSGDTSDDMLLILDRKASGADGALADQIRQQQIQSFHQENRFLGCLEIPFTTLYHNHGTLDATLRCETPVVNVGYMHPKRSTNSEQHDEGAGMTSGGTDREDDGALQASREATYLSVMMTLDPLLPMPVKSFEENALSAGDDYAALAAYAVQWKMTTQNLNGATKHRDFHVFVRSLSHGQTFVARYISPQVPPLFDSSGSRSKHATVAQIARFVRLIPFLDDWQLFDDGGALDVWATSQELLDLNAGDFEEHAVLLCNFLNWLDRDEVNYQSFLVLATAVPEGKTVYVLRQDSYKIPQRSVLWNASTGVGYSVLDDRCPVLDVSLVVSSENIYANVQPKKRLSEMNWDIETNVKAWKPFFHGSHKREKFSLPSVQTPQLVYAPTSSEYVQQVEVELREALKLEIRRWRSIKYTTTFNMDLSMKLRGQLERLEHAMLHGVRDGNSGQKKKNDGDPILELQNTRRVSGMPLNTTFTDMDKVISMVKNTNIYWNDHDDVEFGLAVYVHAYPNCILSVWVYLVAVEPLE